MNPVYTNDSYVDTPDTATKLLERVHTRNSNERVRNKRYWLNRNLRGVSKRETERDRVLT